MTSDQHNNTNQIVLYLEESPFLLKTLKGLGHLYDIWFDNQRNDIAIHESYKLYTISSLDDVADNLLSLIEWSGSKIDPMIHMVREAFTPNARDAQFKSSLSEREFRRFLIGYNKSKYRTIVEELEQYKHWLVRNSKGAIEVPDFLEGLMGSLDSIDEIKSGNTYTTRGASTAVDFLKANEDSFRVACRLILTRSLEDIAD